MTASFLDDVVDGKVLQASAGGKGLAVRGLAYAWSAGDYNIGLSSHCVNCCEFLGLKLDETVDRGVVVG